MTYERVGDDLPLLMARLRSEHGIRSVLCEGGPTLNSYLLAAGLVDELFLTLNPKLLGGAAALTIVAGRQLVEPAELELVSLAEGGGELFTRWRVFPLRECRNTCTCASEQGISLSMSVRMASVHTEQARPRARRQPPDPNVPVVEFRDVSKVYGGGSVGLDGASMSIGRGEFVFLVGPTGCGKSTCIRLLMKEIEPSKGEILIAGRELNGMPRSRVPFMRRNIGVVFQDYKLLPNRTVYDNVAYSLQVIGETPPGDPPQGAGHPAPRRPLHQAAQLSGRAVGRRAAARVDRPRLREPPAAPARPTSPPATSTPRPRSGSCS